MLGACTKEGKTSGTGTEEETAGSPASRSRTGIVGTGRRRGRQLRRRRAKERQRADRKRRTGQQTAEAVTQETRTGQQAAGTEAVIPGNCSYTMRDGIRTAAG